MIQLTWYDDDRRALVYKFPAEWDWNDFYEVKRVADSWLDETAHPVMLILDFSQTHTFPHHMLSRGRALFTQAHPKGDPLVFVTRNAMLISVADILGRMIPHLTKERLIILPNMRRVPALLEENQQDTGS